MKTSNEIPEIYSEIQKHFPAAKWEDGLIITYGDTAYCKFDLPEQKVIHESVHVEQQLKYEGGAAAWWDRYFIDPEFRFKQEVEAYTAEARYIKRHVKDRNKVARFVHEIAGAMSSAMYGNMVDFRESLTILNRA